MGKHKKDKKRRTFGENTIWYSCCRQTAVSRKNKGVHIQKKYIQKATWHPVPGKENDVEGGKSK